MLYFANNNLVSFNYLPTRYIAFYQPNLAGNYWEESDLPMISLKIISWQGNKNKLYIKQLTKVIVINLNIVA